MLMYLIMIILIIYDEILNIIGICVAHILLIKFSIALDRPKISPINPH